MLSVKTIFRLIYLNSRKFKKNNNNCKIKHTQPNVEKTV